MTGEGGCSSCFEPKPLNWEWPEAVPRPPNIADGPICSDCHDSLLHFMELRA